MGVSNLMLPVVHRGERLWLEYEVKVKRTRKEYYVGYRKIIIEKEEVEGIEVWSVIPEEELSKIILKHVQYLLEKGYDRETIINMIAENYGMRKEDAKEFFDYAEWYLFNG